MITLQVQIWFGSFSDASTSLQTNKKADHLTYLFIEEKPTNLTQILFSFLMTQFLMIFFENGYVFLN